MREDPCRVEALAVLSTFRTDFYAALSARRDVLFELTDALLCTDGPVKSLVDLVLAPEHRRGHGGMYDGLTAVMSRWTGCGGPWPGCRCPGPPAAGSSWRWMCPRGCARTRPPARTGCLNPATANPN